MPEVAASKVQTDRAILSSETTQTEENDMANSDWAREAFKDAPSKSTWATPSPVATAHERRSNTERRTVTHEENGHVWGPPEQLLKLVSVCNVLEAVAHGADGYDRPHLAACLRDQATEIKRVLGISVE